MILSRLTPAFLIDCKISKTESEKKIMKTIKITMYQDKKKIRFKIDEKNLKKETDKDFIISFDEKKIKKYECYTMFLDNDLFVSFIIRNDEMKVGNLTSRNGKFNLKPEIIFMNNEDLYDFTKQRATYFKELTKAKKERNKQILKEEYSKILKEEYNITDQQLEQVLKLANSPVRSLELLLYNYRTQDIEPFSFDDIYFMIKYFKKLDIPQFESLRYLIYITRQDKSYYEKILLIRKDLKSIKQTEKVFKKHNVPLYRNQKFTRKQYFNVVKAYAKFYFLRNQKKNKKNKMIRSLSEVDSSIL